MSANLFAELPAVTNGEVFETLLQSAQVKIERITSHNCPSPEQGWYEQAQDEWVALLSGRAAIAFEENGRELVLKPGDYLHIPAHQRHKVLWTDADEASVWLAIHLPSPQQEN